MNKFLFIYRGDDEKDLSPEEMQGVMQQWMEWIGKAMEDGWMVAPGDALIPEGRVVRSDKSITDGPFAESKEVVGGYSIIQAESLEAASELAKDCPGLLNGGSVEIRQLAMVAVEPTT